jgi:hypothetical protein
LGLDRSRDHRGQRQRRPARYNPLSDSDAGLARARIVLTAMQKRRLHRREYQNPGAGDRPRIVRANGTPVSAGSPTW